MIETTIIIGKVTGNVSVGDALVMNKDGTYRRIRKNEMDRIDFYVATKNAKKGRKVTLANKDAIWQVGMFK